MKLKFRGLVFALAISAALAAANTVTAGEVDHTMGRGVEAFKYLGTLLPTGQWITPTAAPG